MVPESPTTGVTRQSEIATWTQDISTEGKLAASRPHTRRGTGRHRAGPLSQTALPLGHTGEYLPTGAGGRVTAPCAPCTTAPERTPFMKVVVIGGTGLIGSKVVSKLNAHGHEAVAASPNTGVNTLTGEGLAEVLQGAQVVVDVSNSPSWEDDAVMNFFRTCTGNLMKANADAGVTHHVALSIVGTDRLPENGYFRAKLAQEELIKASGIAYSIVHATQFFEFVNGIADAGTEGDTVHIAPVKFQPIYSDDVATAVARTAAGEPLNGVVEIAGPDVFRFDDLVRDVLTSQNDSRKVVADPHARYYGSELQDDSLVPGPGAQLAATRFADWFAQQR